ncbi:MAG: EscU/YscU/HrcU family type III secretion system export apparatus switch protein, partial [Oscillospiraceae bacterium]|nr:EscU/YscU/HrcU family type III secretion system export apparatus switch protein [Oscillospiraceae bacterium]
VKEEYKQTEGDPKIKGKIKQKQQQMAMQRMMQAVPDADVIIRNPTHIAIAIQYDKDKDIAPRVIAKGADNVAMKIIEVATEHKVLMQENIPLAHALYDEVDLGKYIPPAFYEEIATIYTWVYEVQNLARP